MGHSKKWVVGSALLAAVVASLASALLLTGGETQESVSFKDCTLVLGPSGLFCGEHALASVEDDRTVSIDREELRAVLDPQKQEMTLLVRSEVPYAWFDRLLESLERADVDRFELLLENSVCQEQYGDGRPKKFAHWQTTIQTRRFEAKLVPRDHVKGEYEEADIVRVEPFGIAYEMLGTESTQFTLPDCDKEIFSFCDPTAEPNEFLEEFAALRRAAQESAEDPMGTAESLERKRIDTAQYARRQYPFETMRGQLGDYWEGVLLEVLDEVPMTVVLETIDALVYLRAPGKPRGYSENIANSLETRCQGPKKKLIGVLMLALSDEKGVVLSEYKNEEELISIGD